MQINLYIIEMCIYMKSICILKLKTNPTYQQNNGPRHVIVPLLHVYDGYNHNIEARKQNQQGNQRWQIPRPATSQCLATFTPLK